MFIKVILVVLLLGMLVALFRGLFFLGKDQQDSKRTVRALSWRVGIAVAVIVLLIVSFAMGWIVPHGIGQ